MRTKPKPLSVRIRRLRGEESQESFAKRAGCSQGTVSRVEAGLYDDAGAKNGSSRRSQTGISWRLLRGLARAAGVSEEKLVGRRR